MILHEVDHIYRTIFGFGASGERDCVIFVDLAVFVFEIWIVAHDLPPCFCERFAMRFCLRFSSATSVVSAPLAVRVADLKVVDYEFWRQRSLQ